MSTPIRLLLVDKQVSPHGHLANAALDNVRVIKYDSDDATLAELQQMIRTAHYKNGAPFASIACAQHGCDAEGLWTWTSDLVIDLGGGSPLSPMMQLSPIIEVLGGALEKTKLGQAHIDLLACGLAAFAPRLVVGLEKLYGIDIRASTDNTGNDVNGGDWKMETDDDYDVAADYLDRAKLVAYAEVMAKGADKVPGERFLKGVKKRLRYATKAGKKVNLANKADKESREMDIRVAAKKAEGQAWDASIKKMSVEQLGKCIEEVERHFSSPLQAEPDFYAWSMKPGPCWQASLYYFMQTRHSNETWDGCALIDRIADAVKKGLPNLMELFQLLLDNYVNEKADFEFNIQGELRKQCITALKSLLNVVEIDHSAKTVTEFTEKPTVAETLALLKGLKTEAIAMIQNNDIMPRNGWKVRLDKPRAK